MKGDRALTNNSQLSTLNSQIPKGYKQTEIGIIPEDWTVVSLSAITSLVTNGFVGKATIHYTDANDGVIYVQGYNVEVNSFNFNGIKKVTLDFHKNHQKSCLKKDDLLTVQTGEVGLTTIVPDELEGANCHALIISRFQKDISYPLFYAHYFNSFFGRSRLKELEVGTTMKHINVSDLLAWEVPYLPKKEQNLIASALSDTDALIESLEQLLAKKRQLKQGAMQELLTGESRLQGFSGKWHNVHLRDCLLSNPDYGINAAGVPDSGSLPIYLRITDIDDDGRLIRNERVAVDHPQSFDYILSKNEIVFARTGASVGKSYLYNANDGELIFAGFLIRAKIDTLKLCPDFLAAFTRTSQYWNWVRMMSMRSGQPGINGNEYSGLNLHLPPLPEQTAIAAILSDMDLEIGAIETKLTKARQLKQGMMHELLTGRIRLIERAPS